MEYPYLDALKIYEIFISYGVLNVIGHVFLYVAVFMDVILK